MYNSLNPHIKKQAKTLLLPVEGEERVLYGMDNSTGNLVSFNFARATTATLFNSNIDMKVSSVNIPRIDYGNYSKDAKILIEKDSTNVIPTSEILQKIGQFEPTADIAQVDVNFFNFISKGRICDNKDNTIDSGFIFYNIQNFLPDRNRYLSAYVQKYNNDPLIVGNGVKFDIDATTSNGKFEYSIYNNITRVSSVCLPTVKNLSIKKRTSNNNLLCNLSGAQLEVDECTSYIPTLDSQVTRSADLLSYELTTDCSVYLRTTKKEVILDKIAGTWNIHEDLNNEGILEIAIFDKILTDIEKLELLFFDKVLKDRGIIDYDAFISSYKNLSEEDKQADTIIIPGAYKEGFIYALNKDYSYTKLDFSRASSATVFNKDLNIESTDINIPRIDYCYYNNSSILNDSSSSGYYDYEGNFVQNINSRHIILDNTKPLVLDISLAQNTLGCGILGVKEDGTKVPISKDWAYRIDIIFYAPVEYRQIIISSFSTGVYYCYDYTHVDHNPQILIERASTNMCTDSDAILNNAAYKSNYVRLDVNNELNHFTKMYRVPDPVPTDPPTGSMGAVYHWVGYPEIGNYAGSFFRYSDHNSAQSISTGFSNVELRKYPIKDKWGRLAVTGDKGSIGNSYFGVYKYNPEIGKTTSFTGFQMELGHNQTSYIPTQGSQVTRSADLLSISLASESTVKLRTSKQDRTFDKNAGVWNIHEDLNNEGIYSIIINKN